MELISVRYTDIKSKIWWTNLWSINNFNNWNDADDWLLDNFNAVAISTAKTSKSKGFDIKFDFIEDLVRFKLTWVNYENI